MKEGRLGYNSYNKRYGLLSSEYEAIRDDLIAYAYGIWDHIKNNKEGIHEHHAENYALEWVGALPGVRESRRLVGDYLLSETDILEHKIFEDAVCYGGWCVAGEKPSFAARFCECYGDGDRQD